MKRLSLILTLALLTGGVAAQNASAPAPLGEASQPGFAAMGDARQALRELFTAYERGDVLSFENQLDASVIGRSRIMEALRRDASNLRNVRMHLFETQMTAGPDVAVISTRWEKRFLGASDLQPGLVSGRSSFLMHREGTAWRMASISGDNPFGGASGVRGTLSVAPNPIPLGALPLTPAVYGPFVVEVVDGDLVGRPSISVELQSAQGDREVLTLSAVGPGRFRSMGVNFHSLSSGPAVVPGNNVVEIFSSTSLTVRYLDQTPGNNRPPLTLSRRIAVQ